jgi:hypothetical protein
MWEGAFEWVKGQTAWHFNPFKPTGHYSNPILTFSNSTFYPHSAFACFVWIWEQTAIISLYNINWLVFINERECVYCAVRTGSLNVIRVKINVALRASHGPLRQLRLQFSPTWSESPHNVAFHKKNQPKYSASLNFCTPSKAHTDIAVYLVIHLCFKYACLMQNPWGWSEEDRIMFECRSGLYVKVYILILVRLLVSRIKLNTPLAIALTPSLPNAVPCSRHTLSRKRELFGNLQNCRISVLPRQ